MARTALSHHTSHSTIRSPRVRKREAAPTAVAREGRVAAGAKVGLGLREVVVRAAEVRAVAAPTAVVK